MAVQLSAREQYDLFRAWGWEEGRHTNKGTIVMRWPATGDRVQVGNPARSSNYSSGPTSAHAAAKAMSMRLSTFLAGPPKGHDVTVIEPAKPIASPAPPATNGKDSGLALVRSKLNEGETPRLSKEAIALHNLMLALVGPGGVFKGKLEDEVQRHPEVAQLFERANGFSARIVYSSMRELKRVGLLNRLQMRPLEFMVLPFHQARPSNPSVIPMTSAERDELLFQAFAEAADPDGCYRGSPSALVEAKGIDDAFCDEDGIFRIDLVQGSRRRLVEQGSIEVVHRGTYRVHNPPSQDIEASPTPPASMPRPLVTAAELDAADEEWEAIERAKAAIQGEPGRVGSVLVEVSAGARPPALPPSQRAQGTKPEPEPEPETNTGTEPVPLDLAAGLEAVDYEDLVAAVAEGFWKRFEWAFAQLGTLSAHIERLEAKINELENRPPPKPVRQPRRAADPELKNRLAAMVAKTTRLPQ